MTLINIIESGDFKQSQAFRLDQQKDLQHTVSTIISDIIQGGDKALINYTKKFDGIKVSQTLVPEKEIVNAEKCIKPKIRYIFEETINNIRNFHEQQIQKSWSTQSDDGTILGEQVRPIDRVGVYIPGGKAFYPSSMIMNTVPAQIAGVESILVASPPDKNGLPNELVLGICGMMGLKEVLVAGGAQAIAAMAYGTETIQPVFKITGPGNKYVAEAKRQVFGKVGIDSVAGPSEILILHNDPDIPVEFLVRDLLTQAEHDEDASAILITCLPDIAKQVQQRINKLVPTIPRSEIIKKSLKNNGKIILIKELEHGIDLVNSMAPEHLELLVTDQSILEKINNAGAIFVGKWSTETVGDYFAGPNHTIPTSGAAKYSSPLSVRDFQKHSSVIEYSNQRLLKQADSIIEFAELEGLNAHAAAIRQRLSRD